MHSEIQSRFPRLGRLYCLSKTESQNNYFRIYNSPKLRSGTEEQFTRWEGLLSLLDDLSLEIFYRKNAGRVCASSDPKRGWTQLVEAFHELKAYEHAINLGYTHARLIEAGTSLPDVEASREDGRCLIEAKTINVSNEDVGLTGQQQCGEVGLPIRLERAIRSAYKEACKQIARHPHAHECRQICFLVINLDLSIVLVDENRDRLSEFLDALQGSVEIETISRCWPATT